MLPRPYELLSTSPFEATHLVLNVAERADFSLAVDADFWMAVDNSPMARRMLKGIKARAERMNAGG